MTLRRCATAILAVLALAALSCVAADPSASAAAPGTPAAVEPAALPTPAPAPQKPAPLSADVCPTAGYSCSTYFEEVKALTPAEAAAVAARAPPAQLSNGAAPWNTVEPCPTDSLAGRTASQIEAQMAACINAVRVNPARYKAAFDASTNCAYSSWIAGMTTPKRKALSYTDPASVRLDAAARKHALDMATRNFFSHTGSDGSSPMQRARTAGYTGYSLGENIAAGYTNVRRSMVAWMCSTGHRNNLMSCSWSSVGSGYAYASTSTYKHYYVQDFGCNAASCRSCL